MEKYSVLMTVYKKDNPEYFLLSLRSMINQSYRPDEIIIVKDGIITHELQSVIDKCKTDDISIKEVQLSTNKGLGLALNEGLKYCTNELIARMDSDDYSMPTRCELQVKAFDENKTLTIVGCQVREFECDINNIIGERRVPLDNDEIYKFIRTRDPFNHPTVMYRKSAVEAVGGYGNYRKNQDTDLWIKMLQNHAVCKNLDGDLFRFRFDKNTYAKRKTWLNTSILIGIRYRAWRSGFNTFFDFFKVAVAQTGMYILPVGFQKFLYRVLLRR